MKSKRMLTLALSVVLLLSVCLSMTACFGGSAYDEQVEEALELVTEAWEEEYEDLAERGIDVGDSIKIVNTQVVVLEKNAFADMGEPFEGAELIVEFEILSDCYGYNCDYYANDILMDTVVFYEDGSSEVLQVDLLKIYSHKTFNYDYSDIIDEVIDLGDAYNDTIEIN